MTGASGPAARHAAALALCLGLLACGQSGALYLPDSEPSPSPSPAATTN